MVVRIHALISVYQTAALLVRPTHNVPSENAQTTFVVVQGQGTVH